MSHNLCLLSDGFTSSEEFVLDPKTSRIALPNEIVPHFPSFVHIIVCTTDFRSVNIFYRKLHYFIQMSQSIEKHTSHFLLSSSIHKQRDCFLVQEASDPCISAGLVATMNLADPFLADY